MVQSVECRDSVLEKSPLSNWLSLVRDREYRLHREILHLVSAVLSFPLYSESDVLTISLIFDHLLQRCSPDVVEETFEAMAIACENHPDYQFFLTRDGIFERMMGFLRAQEHCGVISRVLRLIASRVEILLDFESLERLFCFVIAGEIADQRFIENMCGIVGLSCGSPDSIEIVMRAGGYEVLKIAGEEGAFESKMEAVKAIHRIAKSGSARQKCCLVESGILERLVDCVESEDGRIVCGFLETFRLLFEAVLMSEEVRLIQMVVGLFENEVLAELGESEEPRVLEMLWELESRISTASE
jgi:hypothetical protein